MSDSHLTPDVGDRDHVDGPSDALATLVEFGDYECPFCGMAYPIVKELRQRFIGQIRFAFRNFPLSESHPHAEHAAESAEAVAELAGNASFWAMHDALYENQNALDDESLADYADEVGADADAVARALASGAYRSRVRSDFKSGVLSGVNGTPTFFINGARFDGVWQNVDEFALALQGALVG